MNPLQPSVIETIGVTPLIELSRITASLDGRILAKLEYFSPGASKKDRIARQIIEDAQADGVLQPGQTVVELTSGSTGTGLAIVCGIKGYPFVAVMSKGNSPERARMMAAFGAEVVLVDQLPVSMPGQVSGGDLDLVEQATRRIVTERRAFRADQFNNLANFRAHYLHTAPEILQQSPYPIDVFCDFVGTGGTFAGCAASFKEANAATRCFVVEPQEAAVLAGCAVLNPNHRIQGGGYAMRDLSFIRRADVDGFVQVTDDEAIEAMRLLARREGVFAGISTGANLAAALKLLQGEQAGKTVVIIAGDSGMKYLSTELWL
ncbi:MAG TPA: cysteine synthase family protein [Abditibacteriaceae bacterium]|nr:cysteine synthase family protein [Abditibacteriaceae bacterium]